MSVVASCLLVLQHQTVGVVAVYALNDEFKSIIVESKNGMVSSVSYVLAKTILVLPIMFIFALFAIGIPMFAIQDYPRGGICGSSAALGHPHLRL